MTTTRLAHPNRWFVYCYLRTSSNRPYYIGLASRPDRPLYKRTHNCSVPNDRSRIRVMRSGLSREQAIHWERFYIARYGRKDMGTGCLMNRTAGGDCPDHSPAAIEKIREAAKRPENIERVRTMNIGRKCTPEAIEARVSKLRGIPRPQHVIDAMQEGFRKWRASTERKPRSPKHTESRAQRSATKYGLTVDAWSAMTRKQRNALRMWCVNNPDGTAADYLAGIRSRSGPAPKVSADQVRGLKEQGVSQAAIARELGCNPGYVSRILSGARQSGVGERR
jgi:hypothetical protein